MKANNERDTGSIVGAILLNIFWLAMLYFAATEATVDGLVYIAVPAALTAVASFLPARLRELSQAYLYMCFPYLIIGGILLAMGMPGWGIAVLAIIALSRVTTDKLKQMRLADDAQCPSA